MVAPAARENTRWCDLCLRHEDMRLRGFLTSAVLASTLFACAAHPEGHAPPRGPMAYSPSLARDAAPPPGTRRMTLLLEDPSHAGTLVNDRDLPLCALPCTAWVPSESGWTVDVAVAGRKPQTIRMPDDLDFGYEHDPASQSLTAVARPKRGHPGAARTLLIAGIPITLVGGIALSMSAGGTDERGVNPITLAWGIGLVTAGVAMITGGAAWGAYSRPPAIDAIAW
jgi:hypothetical protein